MAKDKYSYYLSEEEIVEELQKMEQDPAMVTKPSFTTNSEAWAENKISFVGSHLAYLKSHKYVNPEHYLSNLRLTIRKKSY